MRNSPPLAGSDRVFYPDISAWRPRSHLPSWFVTCRPASSFGLFIDELGKFITSDNNYFYRPAIALIYVVFVLFFLRLRTFERHRRASEDVYLANALVLLQDAAIHDLDLKEKNLLLHWLRSSGSAGTGLLGNVVETVQKRRPDVYPRNRFQRQLRSWRRALHRGLRSAWTGRVAVPILIFRLVGGLLVTTILTLRKGGDLGDVPSHLPLLAATGFHRQVPMGPYRRLRQPEGKTRG